MRKILVPENAGDIRVIDDMLEQSYACENDPKRVNRSMEAVVIRPNHAVNGSGEWARFTVVDNRDHQCFTEDFETLDGAMIYASDMRTTTERQHEWDVPGQFLKELSERVKNDAPASDSMPSSKKADVKVVTLVDLLPLMRGYVSVSISTVSPNSSGRVQKRSWCCTTARGGGDMLECIRSASYMDAEKVLMAKATIGNPIHREDGITYTNVEVEVEGVE